MPGEPWAMPEPQPEDFDEHRTVSIARIGENHMTIGLGNGHFLLMSEYSAAQLFGLLALFLEIPLTKQTGKAIHLGNPKRPWVAPVTTPQAPPSPAAPPDTSDPGHTPDSSL